MPRYRKKPVVIDAVQYTGILTDEITNFLAEATWGWDSVKGIEIATLEGVMVANPFDWIIKGIKGEYYPCKPDIFEMTYEPLESDDFDSEQAHKELLDELES